MSQVPARKNIQAKAVPAKTGTVLSAKCSRTASPSLRSAVMSTPYVTLRATFASSPRLRIAPRERIKRRASEWSMLREERSPPHKTVFTSAIYAGPGRYVLAL